jgi:hypothetical protein
VAVASSLIVFHSPQASQRPCQRPDAAPQFWQTKLIFSRTARRAKGRSYRSCSVLQEIRAAFQSIPFGCVGQPATGVLADAARIDAGDE